MNSRGVCLVIEDGRDIRGLIGVILTRAGFDVHAVTTGAERIAAAGNLDPAGQRLGDITARKGKVEQDVSPGNGLPKPIPHR